MNKNGTELEMHQEQVEHYLSATHEARLLSERDRDYRDHKQWTPEQISKIQQRGQAPITVNRIKPKMEGLVGLYMLRNTDPKAVPRTQKHEQASEAATDALRFVADNNDFPEIKSEVADEFWVEGYAGAAVIVEENVRGEVEVKIDHIPWDRIYYDPFSRRKDFKDARYLGVILWMDKEEVKEKFPDADVDNIVQSVEHTDETFEDRPRWVNKKEGRIRLALHFYMKNNTWHMCYFTGGMYLLEPIESPYLDEDGQPTCPIELISANVDRDNNRYGEVRALIDQQNEVNHRRSKWLNLLSHRQTYGRNGAVKSVAKLKRELAKPDGHVEFNGEKFGDDFGILPTSDMAQGQVSLYQDAKAEMDAVSFNAQLAGERQQGDLSGRAIDKLQAAGTIELNRQFNLLNGWEKRIYRQVWARIKQFWNEEKWIRVTDDRDNLRWVGLNTQITAKEFLEEKINDESSDLQERRQAAASYMFLQQNSPEALEEIVGIRNETAELDVDIILDQAHDTINIQQEQFQLLMQFAQGSDIDIIELIELSQLRNKDDIIDKIKERREAAVQAGGNAAEVQAQAEKAKTAKIMSETQKNTQEAIQKQIENTLLINSPSAEVTSVSV